MQLHHAHRRRRYLRWFILAAIVAGLAIVWVYRYHMLSSAGKYLNAPTNDVHADVGFILGGGRNTRADYAKRLLDEGRIDRIMIAGAGPLADVDGVTLLTEQELLAGMLEALGVPPEQIDKLPDICESTDDEARALARYLEKHPGTSVVVITSDYHTRRCRLIFDKVFAGKPNQILFAGAPTGIPPDQWWKTPQGAAIYGLELIKLASAQLKSWW